MSPKRKVSIMSKQLSKTCPNCGKLNSIHESYCTNCGHKLPVSSEKTVGYTRPQSKCQAMIVFAILGLALFLGVVGISIRQNQEILRTSSINAIPFKVEFFDHHNHQVMVRYLKGETRKSRNGYATGTLKVMTTMKHGHGQSVSYVDSRAAKSLVINSSPKMTFYYNHRYGKFNDYGKCKVSGQPTIKRFRMIKMD